MLRFHPPDFLRQISSLGLELSKLARQAGEPRDPSCLHLPVTPSASLPRVFGAGLSSLGLCGREFTNGVFSPAPPLLFSGLMSPFFSLQHKCLC